MLYITFGKAGTEAELVAYCRELRLYYHICQQFHIVQRAGVFERGIRYTLLAGFYMVYAMKKAPGYVMLSTPPTAKAHREADG